MKKLSIQPACVSPHQNKRRNISRTNPAVRPIASFPFGCILALLAVSRELRPVLVRLMGREVFSEAQLATLVALYSLGRCPHTAAVLSDRTGVSPTHLVFVVDSLVARSLVKEGPDTADESRRIIRLTQKGREAAIVTVHLFLETANILMCGLSAPEYAVLEKAGRQLTERAREISAANSEKLPD